jgi:hypothetical protein
MAKSEFLRSRIGLLLLVRTMRSRETSSTVVVMEGVVCAWGGAAAEESGGGADWAEIMAGRKNRSRAADERG